MSLAEGREDSPRDHKAERAPPCGLFLVSSQAVRVVQNHKARSPLHGSDFVAACNVQDGNFAKAVGRVRSMLSHGGHAQPPRKWCCMILRLLCARQSKLLAGLELYRRGAELPATSAGACFVLRQC